VEGRGTVREDFISTEMHGTISVMTGLGSAPTAGEKTVWLGTPMTSGSSILQLRSGMAETQS
jgi:hypothetical protein